MNGWWARVLFIKKAFWVVLWLMTNIDTSAHVPYPWFLLFFFFVECPGLFTCKLTYTRSFVGFMLIYEEFFFSRQAHVRFVATCGNLNFLSSSLVCWVHANFLHHAPIFPHLKKIGVIVRVKMVRSDWPC